MLAALIPLVGQVLDRILPDEERAGEAKLKFLTLVQTGELAELNAAKELNLAQIDVNKAEAASSDPYTSRWRPTIGYILAFAIGYQYILNPLIVWSATLWFPGITPPSITIDEHMWELIFGLLGLAGFRTAEKIKGRA